MHYSTALLRQTNPLWVAYFFVTDTNPFDDRYILIDVDSVYMYVFHLLFIVCTITILIF